MLFYIDVIFFEIVTKSHKFLGKSLQIAVILTQFVAMKWHVTSYHWNEIVSSEIHEKLIFTFIKNFKILIISQLWTQMEYSIGK